MVFVCRYLDLFFSFISMCVPPAFRCDGLCVVGGLTRASSGLPRSTSYNTLMKIIFITATLTIIWYMRKHKTVSQTYSKDEDTFKAEYLLVPCFLLALLVNHELSVMEVRALARHVAALLHSRRDPHLLLPGPVDVLHLPGGCGHPAAAGHAAELRQRGQSDRALRVFPGVSDTTVDGCDGSASTTDARRHRHPAGHTVRSTC